MTHTSKLGFKKKTRLKKKRDFDRLFQEGKWAVSSELKVLYLTKQETAKTGVVTGKRFFKKAVDRNRVKRLLREAYRLDQELWKETLGEGAHLLLIWNTYRMPKNLAETQALTRMVRKKLHHQLHPSVSPDAGD